MAEPNQDLACVSAFYHIKHQPRFRAKAGDLSWLGARSVGLEITTYCWSGE